MSNLLINEPPLQVLPTLAKRIGLSESIVLQQVHFWLGYSKNERYGLRWVYKTYAEWHQEFSFWSLDTVGRVIRKLEDMELLIGVSWFNKMSIDRTKWYTIDYYVLGMYELTPPMWQNATMEAGKMPQSDNGKMPQSDNGKMPHSNQRVENTTEENSAAVFWRDNMNSLLPSLKALEEFKLLMETYPKQRLLSAMETSKGRGKYSVAYVRGILHNEDSKAATKPAPVQDRKPARIYR